MAAKITGSQIVNRGMAQMQKGGVIMDVVNAEQAKIAEAAGAVAVMALERVPSDIRAAGGVARMADPTIVEEVMKAVSIPVMAKARIGHITEARILEAMGVDYIDESEVLTPADEQYHILKKDFTVPFVCGCRDLGEALRRVGEGASMLRTKGEPGTGNIVEAVRHMRRVTAEVRAACSRNADELIAYSPTGFSFPTPVAFSGKSNRSRCAFHWGLSIFRPLGRQAGLPFSGSRCT